MKVLAVLAVLIAAVYGQTGTFVESGAQTQTDPFIALIKEIETASFFPQLKASDRLLTFEMLTAAETKNLELLFNRLGYVTLLEYLDVLPSDYQHRFIRYSIEHLNLEDPAKVPLP